MNELRFALTVPEAAKALGISRSKCEMLVASGEIASFKIGRLRRIRPSALDDYIRVQEVKAAEERRWLQPEEVYVRGVTE